MRAVLRFVLVARVFGFVVPPARVARTQRLSARHAKSARMGFRAITKAVATLLVPPPPPPPSTKIEGSELFRFLGVPPTADYEEVQEAVVRLKAKYEGDKKMTMRIDVTKDKIAELRLRQRMRGTIAATQEALYVDLDDKKREAARAKRKALANRPRWMKRIPLMWKPFWIKPKSFQEREWLKKHVRFANQWACLLLAIALFFPNFIPPFRVFGVIIFAGHMAGRGIPPPVKGEGGMIGEVRQVNYGDYYWIGLILAAHCGIGLLLSEMFGPYMPLVRPKQARFIFCTLSYYAADLLWQVHLSSGRDDY